MKALKIGVGVIVVTLVVLVFSLPITTTPGFFIFGNASVAPANWPDTSSILETKIRVPGIIPRVVIIWFVEVDNDMYIVGSRANGWTSMLGDGGPIHMRIEDLTYPLLAERVSAGTAEVLQAWEAKYTAGYPEFFNSSAADEYLIESAVYRLMRL
ncbi:MAG: hypothetical protein OXU66_00550 [Gammaproteobacteria bacterium]|nr:hypothetical protein [Gammaproteobacteria bacterium]MDD9896677.1 hypothetical protein [Gammaproteobacteria bacterium]MDD9957403.1 hypothetical protein [Gammaproteobacteria bacterium]